MIGALLSLGLAHAANLDGGAPPLEPWSGAAVPSATLAADRQLLLALRVDHLDDPLVLRGPAGRVPVAPGRDAFIAGRTVGRVGLGAGLGGVASARVDLPVLLHQDAVDPERPSRALPARALGDLTVEAAFAPPIRGPFALALRLPLGLPTGSAAALVGAPGAVFRPALAAEWALGDARGAAPLRFGAAVGGVFGPAEPLRDRQLDDGLSAGASLGWHPTGRLGLRVEGVGGWRGGLWSAEALGGVSFAVADWHLRLGGGAGLVGAPGTPDLRALAALTWAPDLDPRRHNRDGDALVDSADGCPDAPEDRDGHRDDDGCPEPDDDQDGILDGADTCPREPEDRDGHADDDGCPDPDDDLDGIPDAADRCPREPERRNGFADDDGCPDEAPLPTGDTDGDGYADDLDLCPAAGEDWDGFADADGCPEPDNDQDGIPDAADACPDLAEVLNALVDGDGCPDADRVRVEKGLLRGAIALEFAPGAAEPTPAARGVLAELGAHLAVHPELRRVRVEAHVAPGAAPRAARRLSEARAEAVRAALLAEGVDPARVDPRGMGDLFPPNDLGENPDRAEIVVLEVAPGED